MMLFLADVRVKVNRRTPLCKRSGGDTETCEIKNKNVSRAALGVWSEARSLGFAELVDLRSQDEIALRQAVDLVRPGRNLDFSPGKENVWVVPLLLRKLTYAVYELEGFAKVGKLEGLRDMVFINNVPSVHLLLQWGEFFTL
jgi:hypothetical protein